MDLKEQVEEFFLKWNGEDNTKVKIAMFGQPGAGKSSLINELVGEKIAQVSAETDTTKKTQVVEYNDLVFVDLPGYDTSEYPTNAYFTQFEPLQYDLFVCVFSGKIQAADVELFGKLTKCGRKCIVVRNKADGLYDPAKSLETLKGEIIDDVRNQLGQRVTVIFTSCKKNVPACERGIPALQQVIINNLGEASQDKFLRNVRAYTKKTLEAKKAMAAAAIKKAMVAASANGLNPIIGVDVGIDLKILSNMYKKIRKAFAITDNEIKGSVMKNALVEKIALGLKKESVTEAIRKTMSENAQKKAARFIPLAGKVATMGMGAGSMYYLGMEYLNNCYKYAAKRLEDEIHMRES